MSVDKEVKRLRFKDIFVNLCSTDIDHVMDYINALESNHVLSDNDDDLLGISEVGAITRLKSIIKETNEVPSLDTFNSLLGLQIGSDFHTHDVLGVIRLFIKQRKNSAAADKLIRLSDQVRSDGITPEVADALTDALKSDAVDIKYENVQDKIVGYYETSVDNSGIKTGIEPVDEVIGGLKAGQVSVIAGFTGMGKSICSVSIMHSAVEQGYNVCYLSLELSSEHLMYNMISRHSLENKFSKKIEHRHLKSKTLSRTDWDYTKEEILPDLKTLPGKFYILDERDIEAYNYFAFDNKLQEIEDLCFEETGKGLDLIIVDHIQMLAFSDQGSRLSENTVINRWCNYFRQQCLDFLKSKRQIHVILVAQINRQGYLKAAKNGGMYDMTALKEANEIETCASVILGVFSDTSLITSNQTKVGILKNRDGSRAGEAYQVSANYPYQLIGGIGSTISSVMATADIGAFDAMMNDFDELSDDVGFQTGGVGITGIDDIPDSFEQNNGLGIKGI